jgi:high affinity sulfate transporter 1
MNDQAPLSWRGLIPDWVRSYRRDWLQPDVIAGLTVWGVAVPESVAYAQIAGVQPFAALSAAPIALVAYAVFGSSRQVTVGATTALAILSASIVAPLAAGESAKYAALSAMLAIIVGAIFLLAAVLRAGFVAAFTAKPVITGFTFGLAMIVAVGQLPRLVGVSASSGSFFERLWHLLTHLNQANGATLLIAAGSLLILTGVPRLVPRVPAALISLVFGIAAVSLFNLHDAHGVAVVGAIPSGLPAFARPAVGPHDIANLIPAALGLVFVGFSEHLSATHISAQRHGYDVDHDRELFALGVSNLGAGLFTGFASGGSLSRTAVNDLAGARSQMSSLVVAAAVVITTLALTPLFKNLPEATLAAIVITAIWHLFNVGELRRFLRFDVRDFGLALTALLGVLVLGVLSGLAVAVILSLLLFVYHAGRSKIAVLGKMPGEPTFADVSLHPDYPTYPGVLIVRPNQPMFFANADLLRDRIRSLIRVTAPPVKAVLIDLEASEELDITTCDVLSQLATELKGEAIPLHLARVRDVGRDKLQLSGLLATLGPDAVHPTVYGAAQAILSAVAAGEAPSAHSGGA